MSKKDSAGKGMARRSALTGLMLVIIAAVTLEATALIQFYFSQKSIKEEATHRAESQLEATKLQIIDIVNQTESAARNSIWIAQWALTVPDSLWTVSRRIVSDNPTIVGSTVALVPGYDKKHPLFSPYCFREPGTTEVVVSSLATAEYDYPSQEWFTKPIELDAGYWSEPYLDEGGGNILMVTYSVPLHDAAGRIAAVLTADVSLDWLTDLVGNVQVYPNAFSMVVSRAGQVMVCPAESLVMRRTVHEIVRDVSDSSVFNHVNAMLSGQKGMSEIKYGKSNAFIFYAPVEKTGWSMSITVPDEEVYGGIRKIGKLVLLLQLLGLLMIIFILLSAARSQKKYLALNDKKERIENELKIASDIQMSMVPKIFPPFPERKDLDMAAAIVPAKEVGGDLYDFYIRDEKLLFCVGDVSGKGVPASLVMAVTRSMFRTLSAHENSPARIVTAMNDAMSEVNENNMFVTFFLGILDLESGHLRYCNAGHNAPVTLTTTKSPLPVEPNLPLGIMSGFHYKEQDMDLHYDDAIFLYTDGITEAENTSHEQFGEERMYNVLSTRRASDHHLKAMEEAVKGFVGDAPQSDDMTMLFIHYLNENMPNKSERHLVLHNDIQQIPQLAEFVETVAAEKHLDQAVAMALNLALEEAVTNVIMYAYPKGSDGLVLVEAILRDKSIDFILSDNGVEFDPTIAPDADTSLGVEDRPIGGLGIFLVKSIMDSVHYERLSGKNILTMTKNI